MNDSNIKPALKSTEFWAMAGIGGLPLLEQSGWLKNWPTTAEGEMAMYVMAAVVVGSYIWSRTLLKLKYGPQTKID